MDGLGLALFGLFLVSFTVSKPVGPYHRLTLSSSESSESNESSSSEEITVLRTAIQPITLNTMRPDDLHQTNDHTANPGLAQTSPHPSNTEQKVVEVDLNTILGPLQPAVPVTAAPDLVAPDVTTPELRCYTVALTSPEPKPARGDNI